MIIVITFFDSILEKVDFPFLRLKLNFYVSNYYPKNFSIKDFENMLYLTLPPGNIMKKFAQLNCIIIDDGPIISGIAHSQDRSSFVCKHRRTEEVKTKTYIFVYKVFTNSFFKSYTAIAM